MIVKIYQKIFNQRTFFKILQVSFIFFSLGFIMGILEELSFFLILTLTFIFLLFGFFKCSIAYL